jgi:hypothetical protein
MAIADTNKQPLSISPIRRGIPMKIIVGALIAFLLGSVLVSKEAEARCWWNGYNHCRYYHHAYNHHGYYHHAWNHDYYRHDHWYR